jgi:hypothetical protein
MHKTVFIKLNPILHGDIQKHSILKEHYFFHPQEKTAITGSALRLAF